MRQRAAHQAIQLTPKAGQVSPKWKETRGLLQTVCVTLGDAAPQQTHSGETGLKAFQFSQKLGFDSGEALEATSVKQAFQCGLTSVHGSRMTHTHTHTHLTGAPRTYRDTTRDESSVKQLWVLHTDRQIWFEAARTHTQLHPSPPLSAAEVNRRRSCSLPYTSLQAGLQLRKKAEGYFRHMCADESTEEKTLRVFREEEDARTAATRVKQLRPE